MSNQLTALAFDTTQKAVVKAEPNGALAKQLEWKIVGGDVTINPSADGLSCEIVSGTTDSNFDVQCTDGNLIGDISGHVSVAVVPAPVPEPTPQPPAVATDLGLSATVEPK